MVALCYVYEFDMHFWQEHFPEPLRMWHLNVIKVRTKYEYTTNISLAKDHSVKGVKRERRA